MARVSTGTAAAPSAATVPVVPKGQLVYGMQLPVQAVFERGGQAAVNHLIDMPGPLPIPSELDAPGLWLARLEVD